MTPPERSPERDAAILAMLPLVPDYGWTTACLRQAGIDAPELLFPRGPGDMVECHSDLADRRMLEATPTEERLSARIRAVVASRLMRDHDHKPAIRRAVAILAYPTNATLAARCTARTVDAMWHAAGDQSADFSWYTKRATLAAVYTTTLLYWLRDDGERDEATLAYLDRALARAARLGRLRRNRSRPPAFASPVRDVARPAQ